MRIGIDFGTTRVVVAAADRGNYPLVNFETPDGGVCDWLPPVAAVKGAERRYGWEALAVQQDDSGWIVLRALKRCLRDAGPNTELRIGDQKLPVRLLLAEMMSALRTQLLEHSNMIIPQHRRMDAVPAGAIDPPASENRPPPESRCPGTS